MNPDSMGKPSKEPVRLNRFLAMLGVGSRRACDDVIKAGRVTVDGKRVSDPGIRVVPGTNSVKVDGHSLVSNPHPLVLMLNKPTGVVTTASDPQGRTTVIDLVRKYTRSRRLFPVGRLDINTSGLLLLTNDGMLCYRLTHPRYEIPRTYQVRVRGQITDRKLAKLERLASPQRSDTAKASVRFVRELNRESILQITLREGRNRQVRRMCEQVGLRVVKLRRIRFGPLSVKKLPLGEARPLEAREMEAVRRLAGETPRKKTHGSR